MRIGALVRWSVLAAAWAVPVTASALPTCEPARAARTQTPLVPAYREALDRLLEAASGSGKPWNCSGAEIELTTDASPGQAAPNAVELVVRLPDGRSAARPVLSPDMVVPIGEALLARPDEPSPSPTHPSSTSASPRASSDGARGPVKTHEPRLLIDAAAVGRVSADVDAVWSGGSARVTIPFKDWSVAAWARVDVPVKVLDTVAPHFNMSEVCLALAGGYRILREPFELRVSGSLGFGLIRMTDGVKRVLPEELTEGSRADFRTGADLTLAVPFSRVGRFVAGGDFEVTPARFPGRRTIRPELPEVPGFSAGISLGMGVAIP